MFLTILYITNEGGFGGGGTADRVASCNTRGGPGGGYRFDHQFKLITITKYCKLKTNVTHFTFNNNCSNNTKIKQK
jgi:hypothetical protein